MIKYEYFFSRSIYIVFKLPASGFVMGYTIKIENVVASTQIGENIDLVKISKEIKDSEYKPKQFPGLVLRTSEPKAAALVFRSGKIVCTGSKSVEDARRAVKQIVKMLKGIGISVIDEPDVKVQNIVASADLGTDLNLNAIAVGLGLENVEYEPEQFPGLVYRLTDPRVVVLIFGSGKMVVTGGKSPEDAQKAVEKISKELKMLGLM